MIRPMEHPTIEQKGVLDHYLAGQLEPEDEAAFEEHLFTCPDCLRQAQAGEELRRGLADLRGETARVPTAAPGDETSGASASTLSFPSPPTAPARSWRSLAVAAMLVLAPLGVLALRGVDYGRQLAVAEDQLSTVRRSLDTVESELETLRHSRTRVRPAAALRLLPLGVSRAGEAAAVPVLEPPPEPSSGGDTPWVISLELTATPQRPLADAYSLRLLDGDGGVRFHAEGVEPTSYDSLLVILPQGFLEAGDYVFEVFAGDPGEAVARLPLRVGS